MRSSKHSQIYVVRSNVADVVLCVVLNSLAMYNSAVCIKISGNVNDKDDKS